LAAQGLTQAPVTAALAPSAAAWRSSRRRSGPWCAGRREAAHTASTTLTQAAQDAKASIGVASHKVADKVSGLAHDAATFRLTQPLDLPTGLTLTGAGIGKTIITHADSWRANHATLPDPETKHEKFDRSGYLLRCQNDAGNIAISQLTLTGPALHGAIFGMANHDLHLHHLHIENFLYSGIRTYAIN